MSIKRAGNGFLGRTGRWLDAQDDVTRGILLTCAALVALAGVFGTFVYRSQIWNGLLTFFSMLFFLLLAGGLGYGLYTIRQRARATQRLVELTAQKDNERSQLERERMARERAKILCAIRAGNVCPLPDSQGLFLRNSEALWHHAHAAAVQKGELRGGELYVTSLRILFASSEYPLEIPIGSLNAARVQGDTLSLISKSASATVDFVLTDPELMHAHVERSVKAFHRQVDVSFESDSARRIPQDVKTAVFQRDGGRCVECEATDYLEFDHVIPFSKGGASTVDNVQLLCRRCNLKKGAFI